MRTLQIIAGFAMLCVVGCSHVDKTSYTPPSVVPVRQGIEKLRPLVKPEGQKQVADLVKAVDTYELQVDAQAKDLAKAQNDAAYWHGKQEKALKELWIWRSIAIASVLAVVGYIGLKTSWKFFL